MAEQKQDIVEEALEIAAEQLEVVEKSAGLIKRIIWNHKTHVGVAFVVGAGLGSAVTYRVVKVKLEDAFNVLLEEELLKVKDSYDRKYMEGDYADPVSAAAKLIPKDEKIKVKAATDALAEYQGKEPATGDEGPQTAAEAEDLMREEIKRGKKRNVFENSAVDFDWEVEMAKREALSDAEPYVITFEEYTEDDEFEEIQLTYYQGDGVLCDENDRAINDDAELAILGDDWEHFGHGSKDGNIVYVRNPRTRSNIEVVRSDGRYDVEILGVAADDVEDANELRHSQKRPRRMRESDE